MKRMNRVKEWLVPFLLFAGSSGGCGDYSSTDNVAAIGPGGSSGGDAATTASGGSSAGLSPVPTDHRSEAVACSQERAPGSASVVGDCTEDSECTDGMNGRCISPNVVGPLGRSGCSYDTCFGDSDCRAKPCRCRQSATSSAPNYCLTDSNCQLDSDCGPGGFCSPSLLNVDSSIAGTASSGSGLAAFGYFCHTPQDLCLNDSDCDQYRCLPEEGCGWMACGFTSENRWDCFRVGTH